MCAVFERTLLSDKGKALVHEHTGDCDEKTVYSKLCAHTLQSAKANIDSSNVLTHVASSKIGDGTWKSGPHAHILHWSDQVRKHEGMVPQPDHFSEGQKRTMLKNAAHSISDL